MSEQKDKQEEETTEVGFFEHLEELRNRIIYAFIGVIAACILTGIFIDPIMNIILLQPASKANISLQNLRPFGMPLLYFKVIFMSGFIVAFPFVLYQLWKFIAPGLYDNERNWVAKITFFTSVCFMIGISFAYFFMIPTMLEFASTFGTSIIRTDVDVTEYFGFMTMILLASGLIFEMPMMSFVLAKLGIIDSKMLRKYWRHSLVVILILAAIITPTPDPINQLFFAIPLIILYEISILVAKLAGKKKYSDQASETN
ncbi:MAG: twin-arginine translocase subunit TatC [Candidatus Kapabacteria bacterium]|nr:twin-arginine translocase subunit TatC [Ignavibacteriota bacterium]MCW5884649.1 twin-arginine translocase subunit TatC [Candidatus Kapabacteria bacterium]